MQCPVCQISYNFESELAINQHIDECLSRQTLKDLSIGDSRPAVSSAAPAKWAPNTCTGCGEAIDPPKTTCFGCTSSSSSRVHAAPSGRVVLTDSDLARQMYEDEMRAAEAASAATAARLARPPVPAPAGPSPFTVSCPHPECLRTMDAHNFPVHWRSFHASASQAHACPLCVLFGDSSYAVSAATNLAGHLQRIHADLTGSADPSAAAASSSSSSSSSRPWIASTDSDSAPSDDSDSESSHLGLTPVFTRPLPVKPVASPAAKPAAPPAERPKSNVSFVVDTLSKPLDKECVICFAEFEQGDKVARLACFCLLHLDCITDWWAKADEKKAPRLCPTHKD